MVGATQPAERNCRMRSATSTARISWSRCWNRLRFPPRRCRNPLGPGSPYPGLRHFSDKETAIFFGRGEEIRELLERLADPLRRFIAVVGASGSGKSSLVMAGVIPRLPAGWIPVRFTPGGLGDDPFLALAAKLESSLESHGLTGRAIVDRLRARGDLDALARLGSGPTVAGGRTAAVRRPVRGAVHAGRGRAPAALRRPVGSRRRKVRRVRTILTVRADFYPQCIDVGLESLLRAGSYPLAAPKLRALLEMITGPAALAGLRFEDGLPGQLLEDTGQGPGVLALLAFALAELYRARRPDGTLTKEAYERFGRVQGAISQRAEAIFTALDARCSSRVRIGVPGTGQGRRAGRGHPATGLVGTAVRFGGGSAFHRGVFGSGRSPAGLRKSGARTVCRWKWRTRLCFAPGPGSNSGYKTRPTIIGCAGKSRNWPLTGTTTTARPNTAGPTNGWWR